MITRPAERDPLLLRAFCAVIGEPAIRVFGSPFPPAAVRWARRAGFGLLIAVAWLGYGLAVTGVR